VSPRCLVLALCLASCGGSSFGAGAVDGSADVGAELDGVTPRSDGQVLVDGSADAGAELDGVTPRSDAEDLDGSSDVAGDVAGDACEPVSFPSSPPPGCTCEGPSQCASSGQGCLWIVGPVTSGGSTCASGCWLYPVAGVDGCQHCAEHDTCACVRPELAGAGLGACTCSDTSSGPVLAGCP
jgi:hypothetical protein